ncbi:7-cyano-7-deazaguanine synthase [Aeromicrobium flavum]|uniref:7-cyano-7-deazaguanine synthase n=1 Tax=Aeromicrobium flavum TaxID=416568 RepID=UPI0011BE6AD0
MSIAHPSPAAHGNVPVDRQAIVLFSGGLDSTVALWWALAHYPRVRAVTVDYGQVHRAELRAARSIAALTPAEHVQVKIDLPVAHQPGPGPFIRGHGALMASLGAIGAGPGGADIVVGSLQTDPYPDSTQAYLQQLGAGFKGPFDTGATRVITPLHSVGSKASVAALGFQLGAPWNLSWSCRGSASKKPCGACASCASRSHICEDLESRGLDPLAVSEWQRVYGSPFHPSFDQASEDLASAARAFASAGGVDAGRRAWRYHGPDGRARLTPLIVRRPRFEFGSRQASQVRHVRASGILPQGTPWEVLVCEDGSVATTPETPEVDAVLELLLQQV